MTSEKIRPYFWSLKRELWENRFIYLAPTFAAGIILFGFLATVYALPGRMRAIAAKEQIDQMGEIMMPYAATSGLFVMTTFLVAAYYCLGALTGERRDRSILFWKSLPVSDLTTVLAKITIPMAILPAFVFLIITAIQLIMLTTSTAILAVAGISPAMIWGQLPLVQLFIVFFYGLAAQALWHAPVYAWLLMVSAWARGAVFLWAVMPPLALCILERIILHSTHLFDWLSHRLIGIVEEAFMVETPDEFILAPLQRLDVAGFVGGAGLWVGLALAALFLIAAIRLRRYHGPL